MNNKRFYLVMIGITSLLGVGIIIAAALGNSLLKHESKKLVSLKLESQVLDQQQISLDKAKKDIAKYSELEREAKIIVPQDKDQAEAVREIVKIAQNNGISLLSITFPSSTLGQSTVLPHSSGSSSSSSSKTSITQVQPVTGIKGLLVMPITVQQDPNLPIPFNSFINFLSALEKNRRTAQVSNVNIQPNALNRSLLSFSLVINVYIKP